MKLPGLSELSKVPLLLPALALTGGILTSTTGVGFAVTVSLLLVLIAAALLRRGTMAAVCLVFALTGFTLGRLTLNTDADNNLARTELCYSGRIVSARFSDRGQAVRVRVDAWGTDSSDLRPMRPLTVMLAVTEFAPEYVEGQHIRFRAEVERVSERTDLPDETDPATFLLRQHIYYRAILPAEDITVTAEPHGFYHSLRQTARSAEDKLLSSSISPGAKSFLTAAILGDNTLIDSDTRLTFAGAGLAHVLALSGLHVGLITLIITIALFPLYYYARCRRTASAIIILMLWLYAVATGLSPSVVRSVTMASVYLFARIIQREASQLNSLCLAAIVILVFSPGSLFAVSFQLSFAAMLCILLFADRLNFVSQRRRLAYNLMSYVSVSVSAMLGTAVLSMFYFHSFPVYFLIANVVSSLLLPPLIGCGVLVILSGCFGVSFAPLVWLTDCLYAGLRLVTDTVAALPGSSVGDIYLPGWSVLPVALFLILLYASLRKRDIRLWTVTLLTAVAVMTAMALRPDTPTEQRLYVAAHKGRTDLLFPHRGVLHQLTNATSVLTEEAKRDAATRYDRYMGRRGIDSICTRSVRNTAISIGDITMLDCDTLPPGRSARTRYLLLTRGMRSSLTTICQCVEADTILLAADLGKRRISRLVAECEQLQLPCIDLTDRPFSIPLPSDSEK